jgi:hypothetical protein
MNNQEPAQNRKDWSLLVPGWDIARLDTYTLDFLAAHGLLDTYLSPTPDLYFVKHLGVEPSELAGFLSDPIPHVCRHYGAPRQIIESWLAAEGRVRCSAKTKKGTPCRALAKPNAGQIEDPLAWQAACAAGA